MSKDIVKVDERIVMRNELFEYGYFHLSHLPYDTFMYCISIMDQGDEDFHSLIIRGKDFAKDVIEGERWGSLAKTLERVCDELAEARIRFPKDYYIVDEKSGKKTKIGGFINVFQHAVYRIESGKDTILDIRFSEVMKPFLLQAKRDFTIFKMKEIRRIKGGHAKHIYSMLKLYRNKTRKHTPNCSILRIEVEEFKKKLFISGKYKRFNDLDYQVLKKAKKTCDDNELAEITYTYKAIREGRKIRYIEFAIFDIIEPTTVISHQDYEPMEGEIDSLTMAKRNAYLGLIEYGVIPGIAMKQILPTIGGGDIGGYEDVFVEYAIKHFEAKTNKTDQKSKAGALVKWWTENKTFDSKEGEDWVLVIEKVQATRKDIMLNKSDVFRNRSVAVEMTYTEFKEWYEKENTK